MAVAYEGSGAVAGSDRKRGETIIQDAGGGIPGITVIPQESNWGGGICREICGSKRVDTRRPLGRSRISTLESGIQSTTVTWTESVIGRLISLFQAEKLTR
jgi:hypothetical protein